MAGTDPADELGREWPCPKCGCTWFYSSVVFERGYLDDDDVYHHFYPPAANPVQVDLDDVRCAQCRLHFSISSFYALDDVPEEIDLSVPCEEDCALPHQHLEAEDEDSDTLNDEGDAAGA